ncbi:MAG TPA: hypothetical protein VKN14_01300 [Flavobacteriaceae bacterium]|nr:hypothetical protein [Flavobacteriaceae bacterium]
MSIIKEIYDVAKDGAIQGAKVNAIKRALRTELKLNKKLLFDIERSNPINNDRRKDIINMLDITELSAAVKYEIPYKLICNKSVGKTLTKAYNIKRLEGFNFEMLVESLYLKIAYLKKDHNNKSIDLNLRLINIYKYNNVLLELLE